VTAALPASRLSGVIPPVCTPFSPDLEVDVVSLERLVDFLLDGGVDGLFVLGSSSEAAFLTPRQRDVVLKTVAGRAAGKVPVLAGVMDMTTPRVLDNLAAVAGSGCAGIVSTAPYYTRTHPAEIERHYRLIGEHADVPVYAYDLPVSVHSKLEAPMLLRLAADGILAGVKDSSGDEGGMRDLILARDDGGDAVSGFSVLTGSEVTVDCALLMGADGLVPGLGNVDPDGYARLYRSCLASHWARAREEQERLVRLMSIVDVASPARMGRGSAALGAFKTALYLRGVIDCPLTAPPQIPLNEAETAIVRDHLTAAGLLP
jgi:4-hydroxy-tetrahydrodipicolinate synthase